MTVKQLKEKLDKMIEDGRGDLDVNIKLKGYGKMSIKGMSLINALSSYAEDYVEIIPRTMLWYAGDNALTP